MQIRIHKFVYCLLFSATLIFGAIPMERSTRVEAKEPSPVGPEFQAYEDVVRRLFASRKHYQRGDLITRSDVAEVLDYLGKMGWEVESHAAIARTALPDGAFLARLLRTEKGTKFMRKIESLPGGYDRLDRLSAMPGGRKIVTGLVKDKGGDKMIEYLATTQGGHNLGTMVGNSPRAKDLNKPTGKIYEEEGLIKLLQVEYKKQIAKKTTQSK